MGALPESEQPQRERALLALDVFEGYPYAILVVRGDGAVVAHNGAARSLLGARAERLADLGPGTACDLVGCRRPDGPLEGICLFERALESADPLPEVRVDLPPGSGAAAAWVTAAPLPRQPDRVAVELRPGQAHDRRRRTDPHWTRGARLRIFALGRTRVESAEGPIRGRWLENRPGQLLKYLVTERHRSVYADEIAEKLWPDAGIRSLQGVRYYVHALRDRLEPGRPARAPSSFVLWQDGGYSLDRARVSIDAEEFEREVSVGLAAARRGDDQRACEHLRRGLSFYGGDFLADEPYAEWAIGERDRLRGLAADALRALAAIKERTGDLAGAAADMERLTDLEPFDVDVHRELISLTLRRGRRTEALRRYSALRHRMLNTFGEDLDFTLAELAAEG